MLYDLRTYRCRPGTVSAQLAAYAREGFAAQSRHLGDPLFYGTVETGDVNAYVHLWQFQDAADRERRRAALYTDEQWLAYRRLSAEAAFQTEQTNMLLKPAFFWKAGS
ncbi:NIPSNAP family protein [Rhizobium lusitanum]|uniref:NIPSNAP family protein n=1 Tax=Rhizobium lusitanum TaxID=293958 RepID=A0A6L9U8D0_9HYPH|nr:NIPSNAP family protein [Rhizobium lusitanum]NEI71619.1 NIPSNAP family protein [Rhizobium lusitanum]